MPMLGPASDPSGSTRELPRPDLTMRYWTSGPDHGAPTLVLLHGATLDHHAWDPQVEALRPRFRVVAPDLRGHGRSPIEGPFAFDAAVADVLALLDRLDRPVALVGLSLGGNIAQEVVYRAPDRVDALVVADSTCNTAARRPMETPIAVAALTPLMWMSQGSFRERAARATANDPAVREYVRAVNEERPAASSVQILVALLTEALHPDPGYRLPVPTLLLHGADDRMGDIAAGTRAWAEREPLAEYVVVPAAGHASNQDNPAAFTAAVAAFLDRALPAQSPRPGRARRLVDAVHRAARAVAEWFRGPGGPRRTVAGSSRPAG